jgi:membrane-associated phospholipid phosphatase
MFITKTNKIKWKWIAIAAAVVTALCMFGIMWLDRPLYIFLRGFNGGWTHILGCVSSCAAWIVASMAVGIAGAAVKKIWKKKWAGTIVKPAFYIFCAVLSAGVAAGVLKILIGRMRPLFFEALSITGFYPFNLNYAFNSMPSGHATASFAGLVMLGMFFPKIKWATWTLAIIVGLSRIAVGAHFPSDVLLGAFIGMVAADLIKAYLPKIVAMERR